MATTSARSLLLWLFLVVGLTTAQRLSDNNVCRLVTFVPFTDQREGTPDQHGSSNEYGYGNWPSQQALGEASYSLLVTAEMARRHFNDRDNAIVPDLAQQIGTDCPIQLQEFYADSGYSRPQSVAALAAQSRDDVCAVVGPLDPLAHIGVSAFTELWQIPQVAYGTIDFKLSNTDLYPNFVRMIPQGEDYAWTLAQALGAGEVWQRDYIANIYEEFYGEQFENPIEDAEDEYDGYFTITESYDEGSDESVLEALEVVVEEGYRTLAVTSDRYGMVDDLARLADTKGLLNGPNQDLQKDGYFYIFTHDMLPPLQLQTLKVKVDSPLDKMLNGAAIISNLDDFLYQPLGNTFLQVWKSQDPAVLAQINALVPQDPATGLPYYQVAAPDQAATYFVDTTPAQYASFLYDSIIATGIAACQAWRRQNGALGGLVDEDGRVAHVQALLQSNFAGASGPVKMKKDEDDDELTNDRDPSTVRFGLHNLRPGPVDGEGMRQYSTVVTHLYQNGSWQAQDGETFLYYDGSTEEPGPKRTVANANYISKSIQTAGFVLVAIALAFIFGCALWVFIHRNKREVQASQPFFLYLVCLGAALVASSLLFVSFDEDKGWSTEKLSRACAAFPWFFVVGYMLMYCALFSKLWRLSRVLQMRRQAVSVTNSLAPFCVIMLATLIVLAVWQGVDPLQWERDNITLDPLTTYGDCNVSGNYLAYIIPLGFLIGLAILITGYMAWKLKDVQSDLAESKWIFFGIIIHVQTWFIGIPVVIITDDISRDAGYIMYAALAFVFSTAMVALVLGPKIYVWFRDTYLGGQSKSDVPQINLRKSETRVSGIHAPPTISSFNESRLEEYEQEVLAMRKQAMVERQQQQEQQQPEVIHESDDELDILEADVEPAKEQAPDDEKEETLKALDEKEAAKLEKEDGDDKTETPAGQETGV